jgi:hypothetical protein
MWITAADNGALVFEDLHPSIAALYESREFRLPACTSLERIHAHSRFITVTTSSSVIVANCTFDLGCMHRCALRITHWDEHSFADRMAAA